MPVGEANTNRGNETILTTCGLANLMEILPDGSFRCRVVIAASSGDSIANITSLTIIHSLFREIYEIVFGKDFCSNFIEAKKYEKLTVLKVFQPKFIVNDGEYKERFDKIFDEHLIKYSNNIISNSNRIPLNGFITIDKALFEANNLKFNEKNLIGQLFYSGYYCLGYIDKLEA